MADPRKGTGKKPKGSGRRLYTDENPKDTVSIKFATPADARATVAKMQQDIAIIKDRLLMLDDRTQWIEEFLIKTTDF